MTLATQASTPSDVSAPADETSGPSPAAVLPPGQSAQVYTGAENRTFNIHLSGSIPRDAALLVTVDNTQAATLTFDVRSTIVNGRSISVTNRGRDPQIFGAQPIA